MPTIATTVSFNDGTNPVVTVNGPSMAGSGAYQTLPITVTEESAGRTLWSYQMTSKKIRLWPITFNTLTLTMKDNLLDFFFNKAIGPTNPFNYIHTDGTTYTDCRFGSDTFSPRRTERGTYEVAIVLRIEDQAIQN